MKRICRQRITALLLAASVAVFGITGLTGCGSYNSANVVMAAEGAASGTAISSAADVLSQVPEYKDSAYAAINNNVPFFSASELTTTAFENYSSLDSLGRCGVAYANVCKEIMPTEARGSIGSVKPTGWHTVKYEGIDGNYLYNRCHLIGYQLAGENANERNLITGTRYLNIQGMLPFENMVADYVKETGNHVLYRATPLFDGNDLVAKGVLLEAESVEDKGAGIRFNVFCYNVQPGITINYADGASSGTAYTGAQASAATSAVSANRKNSAQGSSQASTQTSTQSYIGNARTKKFHRSGCSSVGQMSDSNKVTLNSRDEAISGGYSPCKKCNP